MANLAEWEHRLDNLEYNITTETDPERLELQLTNYVELLVYVALLLEYESYAYLMN